MNKRMIKRLNREARRRKHGMSKVKTFHKSNYLIKCFER
jgi:hypothetical protein